MPHPETVLIVEDEPLIGLDLASSLEEMGFRAIVATTIREAEDAIGAGTIDFAILDYRVGSATTDKLAVTLREKTVPFLLCSGSDLGIAGRIFEGVPYVPKPYSRDDLASAIGSLVS